MSQLQELVLLDTWVTAKGFAELRAALPGCRVTGEPLRTVDVPEYAGLATGVWQPVRWSDQELDQWRETATAPKSVERLEGGAMRITSNGDARLMVPGVNARNLLLRASVRAFEPGHQFAILARFHDGQYYGLWTHNAGIHHRNRGIGVFSNEKWTDFGATFYSLARKAEWTEWTFAVIEDQLIAYIDGVERMRFTDSSRTDPGQVGIEVKGQLPDGMGTIEFRDVEVMVLDEPK